MKLENRIKSQHKEKNILNILKGLTLYRFLYIKHRSGKKSGHDFFLREQENQTSGACQSAFIVGAGKSQGGVSQLETVFYFVPLGLETST